MVEDDEDSVEEDEVDDDEDEDEDDEDGEADEDDEEDDNDGEIKVEQFDLNSKLELELDSLLSLADSMTGVGGAVFDKLEELISFLDFINSLAEEFISTKEIGNIPTFPLSLPSAQLSSTFLISTIISFLAKEMQSFSSTSVTRKSYNALHCGVGTKREDALGGICTQLAERKP